MAQNPQMYRIDDLIGPHAPIGYGAHIVFVPGYPCNPCSTFRKCIEIEFTSPREQETLKVWRINMIVHPPFSQSFLVHILIQLVQVQSYLQSSQRPDG